MLHFVSIPNKIKFQWQTSDVSIGLQNMLSFLTLSEKNALEFLRYLIK